MSTEKEETPENMTMPPPNQGNPQSHLAPPTRSTTLPDSVRLYMATHPYIYALFSIFCGFGAAVTFVGTDYFASLEQKFGKPETLYALITATMIWPALILYSQNLRGLIKRKEDAWKSFNMVDMVFAMCLMACLDHVYKTIGSPFMVLYLIGCVLGFLEVSSLSSKTAAFVMSLFWNHIAWKEWPLGYGRFTPFTNTIALFFIYWLHYY